MAETSDITASPRRTQFDGATVFGLGAALALITAAVVLGGSPGSFVDIPAVLIVVGGTIAVTTMCFSFGEIMHTVGVLGGTVVYKERDPRDTAYTMLELADFCRKAGALKLQGAPLLRFTKEPFLHKGLAMVIDGFGEKEIDEILRQDLAATTQRQYRAASVLRKAAEVSPAMGLIGTLIGLVQMLGNLQDPDVIGPAMAVALLTTFYGALLATMVFNPLASKLERNAIEEGLINHLQLIGLISISRKDNPRRLEMLLNSALPPEGKVQYFE